ncbi:MAG: pyruvate dehydrogenase (acetyl-transferring), homodimeric type [Verrucomicrobiales bacterium]|nr:pyruvate dehydrogenase (acetyl-transferring), homodimeric type [Verrucomicrobiales bacterium]
MNMAKPTTDGNVRHSLQTMISTCLQTVPEHLRQDFLNEVFTEVAEDNDLRCGLTTSPYINTIPQDEEPEYPGNRELEWKIKSLVRWNAMAMVVNANHHEDGVGGHISTFASSATLYEVGFNHFFRGGDGEASADQVFFQGHASPGPYARAYIEGRLTEANLHNFRRELSEEGGLSSYPHPYLMPDFWQFPTVSMGLGPILSIYQARFNRYLVDRGLLKPEHEPRVWCFVGDGESDEPETLGALTLASREKLGNLIWVLNCNLQRLDGPVRGNGKIIQELEGAFRGAGWNAIKVIWGSNWDELLAKDTKGLLRKRMAETVDGEYQKYSVEPGSYVRKHFFGVHPELKAMVNHMTDDDLHKLLRGGHDVRKVYAAYQAAVDTTDRPTVILAKTIKGYGLGEAGEGRNITHQQKKLNERELRHFRSRFAVPIKDEEIADTPFYRPAEDSEEMKYLRARREALGGYLPKRTTETIPFEIPQRDAFAAGMRGAKGPVSSTQAFVRILSSLLRDKKFGKYIVPIIPDEARTFGMDGLFREVGIYSSKGQLYEPVDSASISYYREAKDGQILEEGITEAGAMSSFISAGSSYSSHGIPMIPFFVYYSMFGFQRVGDLIWLAGDMRVRGFLCGATSGRTSLNGEGLQHQDGHSHLNASAFPSMHAYDPAFGYEIALIIQDGLKRMYVDNEDTVYYLSLYNDPIPQPAMPEGVEDGVLNGLYRYRTGNAEAKHKAHIFGSGPIIESALTAQKMLEEFDISADVWSATSYKRLRSEAREARRWNMLHPTEEPKVSYLENLLKNETGPFVAVSDNVSTLSDQIAPWVPGGLFSLGTDGFGRSESRERLRRFFEVDAECTALAVLRQLQLQGQIDQKTVAKAIKQFDINPDKASAIIV